MSLRVQKVLAADDADVLAGTDIETAPGNGVYEIFAASSQADTLFSISAPPLAAIARNVNLVKRTDGVPDCQADRPFVFPVTAGGKVVVAVDIVTGATVMVIATYFPLAEARAM